MIDSVLVRVRGKQAVMVRGFAERIEGTSKFRFTCPEGHCHTKDLNAGALRKRHPLGEMALRLLAGNWTKERGGVSFVCPKCKP